MTFCANRWSNPAGGRDLSGARASLKVPVRSRKLSKGSPPSKVCGFTFHIVIHINEHLVPLLSEHPG